jgi:ribosomal-protein-alanine N-acetyltransferase
LKCGFMEEGFARKYLRINNQWQDHRTFAIIQADARPGVENIKASNHRYA